MLCWHSNNHGNCNHFLLILDLHFNTLKVPSVVIPQLLRDEWKYWAALHDQKSSDETAGRHFAFSCKCQCPIRKKTKTKPQRKITVQAEELGSTLQSCITLMTLGNPLSLWEQEGQAGSIHWPHKEKIHLPIVSNVFEDFCFHLISDTHK